MEGNDKVASFMERLGLFNRSNKKTKMEEVEEDLASGEISFLKAARELPLRDVAEILLNDQAFDFEIAKRVFHRALVEYKHCKPKGFSDGTKLYDVMVRWTGGDDSAYLELSYAVEAISGTLGKIPDQERVDKVSLLSGVYSYLIAMVEGAALVDSMECYCDLDDESDSMVPGSWASAMAVEGSDELIKRIVDIAVEEYRNSSIM